MFLPPGKTWKCFFLSVQFSKNNFWCRFANGPCDSGTRNGTCYTEAECDSRGGSNSGACAAGFGVCCISEEKRVFSQIKKQQHNYLSSYCWLWCFLQRELYLLWQQQPCGWNMQYGDLSLWRQHMSGNNKTEWEGTIINFSAIHINPMWYRFGWTLTPSLLLAPLQFLHQLPSALGKLEFSVASPLVLLWHPRQPSQ